MNLYLVESPLQLLSAIELQSLTPSKKSTVVIRYEVRDGNRNRDQIRELLKNMRFDRVVELGKNLNSISQRIDLLNFMVRLSGVRDEIQQVAIGDWRSTWMHRCIEIVGAKEPILLDDGIIVVHIMNNFLCKGIHNKLKISSTPSTRFKNILYYALGSNGNAEYKFSLFTSFYNQSVVNNINILENRYEHTVSRNASRESCVGYFGTKYSEGKYLTFEQEITFLSNAFKFIEREYDGLPIVYYAHRGDAHKKLEYISSMGIEVRVPTLPLEAHFMRHESPPPSVIVGGFSTAVINVSKIYGIEEALFMLLPIGLISKNKAAHVIEIYNFYKEMGYRIVDPSFGNRRPQA